MADPGRRLRFWPRTVRGAATAAVTLVTATALAICAGVLLYAVNDDLTGVARATAGRQATAVAEQLRTGAATPALIAQTGDTAITLAKVKAVAPSTAPAGAVPIAVASSVLVTTAEGPYLVEALPDLTPARTARSTMLLLLAASIPLVLLLVAGLTWFAMGRALRPVEAIRAEFAEITAQGLHRRVPDPRSGDEVSRLARTMNGTLDQLHRAVLRLRTFTSDASHELRSPLTTLRTRLELALARPGAADWPGAARECLRDAQQLQEIVEDLLLLARLDAGQAPGREPVVLRDLVHEVAPARSADRLLRIDAATPGPVLGSATALTRLLANLVDNAARHARTTVEVRLRDQPDTMRIEVTDDGPGIPETDRQRVFDRFTRLDDARARDRPGAGGTGLGLAIARDIAVAHGGTLTAEGPTTGQVGARLVLTLPRPPDPVALSQ